MGLETGTTITDLNPNWPLGSDPKSQGDDHIRLVKLVLQNLYPVDSVYLTAANVSPATFIGGTWELTAEGRALVGVGNNGQSDWTVGEERGSETHTLTTGEMPSHTHGSGGLSTNTTGSHSHQFTYSGISSNDQNQIGDGLREDVQNITSNTASAGNHSHTISGSTASAGSGGAHNNVQPSIGVYVWRRTA